MERNTKGNKLKLVVNVPTVQDAEEQYFMAKERHEEEATRETYAAMCRALMVLNTKKIELSPEQVKELRELGKKPNAS